MSYLPGYPHPLGTTPSPYGVNFAFFSTTQSLILSLFSLGSETPFLTVPITEKTNDVWHIFIQQLHPPFAYTLATEEGSDLLDPYAKSLVVTNHWGENSSFYKPKAICFIPPPFHWEGIKKPKRPWKDWIIYEMHVRGFTNHPSSKVDLKGTFLGMIEKIPHLLSLGVNAVELLPIFEFNECELTQNSPSLYNIWGYSTVNFFSPMQRYATGEEWGQAITEWKTLVKELHKNGIAVILDVVYNHTAEGGENGPVLSFKGLSKESYYLLDNNGSFYNFSGTGNTMNCNHPITSQLILDSLSYWAEEMQVDAFRFDLASILIRNEKGEPCSVPPLLEAIANTPSLQEVICIAEAWDAAGLYQVGSFPGKDQWVEWNGQYRDSVRRFLKGTDDSVGDFASALCGSQNIYRTQAPTRSVNFITCHDGYTLHDLVSYQEKHNLENGENNADGTNNNESWNCGTEGETKEEPILLLRERQKKNFILALLVSLGVPMLLMGDEYSHTKGGNNNTYCQDNDKNYFLWNELKKNRALFSFFQQVISFRKERSHLFCKEQFLSEEDIIWHGEFINQPDWSASCRFLLYTLKDPLYEKDCLIAFNAGHEPLLFQVPPPPNNRKWKRIIDTSFPQPNDYITKPRKRPIIKDSYCLPSHSAFIAELS